MKATLVLVTALLGLFIQSSSQSALGTEQNGRKVICYYTNWSVYRNGNSKFLPSDIDPTLCTHIQYSFAVLNSNTLTIESADRQADIVDGGYRQVTAFKEQGVKVLIAIGGWSDSQGNKYSRMVNSASSRANFVNSVVQFIQEHNFDGLDLDWEYPTCWQGDCNAGPSSDRTNFANLIRELRTAFNPRGWLLSAAVSASSNVGLRAYDVTAMSQNLDWIGIMTYDLAGGWDGVTGHHSPLTGGRGGNVIESVNFWIANGASPEKLVVGIPLYGRSFTLTNPQNTIVGASATEGVAGPITEEEGFLAYIEFCTGWTSVHVNNVGPYAYKGNQWTSYDDVQIINAKSQYIINNQLGGALVWAIDLDDFNDRFCGQGRYPLLRALRAAL